MAQCAWIYWAKKQCGKPSAEGRKHCAEHLAEKREKNKKMRAKWATRGLCTSCGAKRDNPFKTKCQKCRDRRAWQQTHQRLGFRHFGLCTCGTQPPPGLKTCLKCRARREAWGQKKEEEKAKAQRVEAQKKQQRLDRKAAGICDLCGKAAVEFRKLKCAECLKKRAESSRRWWKKTHGNLSEAADLVGA